MTSGWIGVDLDGTLAEYHGWNDGVIGKPIPQMVERVKKWLRDGVEVRVFTARVSPLNRVLHPGQAAPIPDNEAAISAFHSACEIAEWYREHIGQILPITNVKDFAMIELWDDRAVQIEPNTGRRMDGCEA